ncbi:hypothetical protein PIB30_068744 [Stylosanthes scabra]|uniref:Uncharacterized protein n=1 Tax=Stylosanthes scabra TaxID=79078 RepID=A0ABU6SNJ1_9FABA|nr:hypothetical protein [Stylosanthes scabra]
MSPWEHHGNASVEFMRPHGSLRAPARILGCEAKDDFFIDRATARIDCPTAQLNSNPDLLVLDPEIQRTLRHIRQVRHCIQFRYFQTEELASESNSVYSSASDIDIESFF